MKQIINRRRDSRGVFAGNWRSDRQPSEEEQAEAEAKISRLNEAKEKR